MNPPSPPRLVVIHVTDSSVDDGSIRVALEAAEIVHEPDPLVALATLGCRELAARSRGTWGLGRAERFAIVLELDRPEHQRLQRACEQHLPTVELWQVRDGRLERLTDAPREHRRREIETPPSARPTPPHPPVEQSATPPRIVTADEIRMLLGDPPADPLAPDRGEQA